MKQIVLTALLLSVPMTPAVAQDDSKPEVEEGFDLMEEGARMLMRGLMSEMEPALRDMRDALEEMGPAFADFATSVGPAFAGLLEQVDDFRYYEAPEFLPNGDIIIRRAPDAPLWEPKAEGDEIEL